MIHNWGWLVWHREELLRSPATPSPTAVFLFRGHHFRCHFHSGSWALWCSHPPWQVGFFLLSAGPRVPKVWNWAEASFNVTASSPSMTLLAHAFRTW